jgi:hypothetical protein
VQTLKDALTALPDAERKEVSIMDGEQVRGILTVIDHLAGSITTRLVAQQERGGAMSRHHFASSELHGHGTTSRWSKL